MAQRTATQERAYLEAFESFSRNGAAADPQWVHALRTSAIAAFKGVGFPVARRGNEEWKYTDIRPIARSTFQLAHPGASAVSLQELRPLAFDEPGWSTLVFVDGSLVPDLSDVGSLPSEVRVMDLADAMTTCGDQLQAELASHAKPDANAFVALNTAFMHSGAFISVPDGTTVETPVHLVFITSSAGHETVSHPRVLVVAGSNSSLTVIESHGSTAGGRHFINAVTEIVVGPGSIVKHHKIQRHSEDAFHIANTQAVVKRDASFSSVNIDLGGGLVRNNLTVLMAEEGGSCSLTGLYMPTGTQHVDNQVIIDHAKGYTNAKELYKGILNGKSRSVFHGSIVVREGAAKVDASQVDKNLLLSSEAEADTKPAFWIYCDDVRCAHGAACGEINEEALFYLNSRGLTESAARRILTRGFAAEIIDSIEMESLRTHVDGIVQARLQEWLGDE